VVNPATVFWKYFFESLVPELDCYYQPHFNTEAFTQCLSLL